MEVLGIVSLILFFAITIGSIKGWIPQDILPIQTSLTLGAILLWVLGLVFDHSLNVKNFSANIYLHPISAVIAGFLVAGALEAAGGFAAAMALLERIEKTRLGPAGAVVLLVNFPNIFSMPCGRIWVVALFPLAVMFGYSIAQKKNNPLLAAVIVFGFIVNAAASCGPSPLGGIGMSGEGLGGYPLGSLSNAQSLAIMVISAVTMISIKFCFKIAVPSYHGEMNHQRVALEPTRKGYYSFFILTGGLSLVFVLKPQIPIQTVLAAIGLSIMAVGRLSLKEVIGGIILHPILAMISGFIFAGALLITGGFDALIVMLEWGARNTPLGYVGVAVLLTFSPSILPMPCGRIIGVALMPGVIMFGQKLMEMNGAPMILPAMLTAFIINAAASCAPSRMGGVGEIGEGLLGVKGGISTRPQQVGILVGTGTAAMLVALFGFL
jgi:hypothetical protein